MFRFTFLHALVLSLIFMIVLLGLSFYALLLREALTECRAAREALERTASFSGRKAAILQRELEDAAAALKDARRRMTPGTPEITTAQCTLNAKTVKGR